jgi:sulfatase maturation enzyme AslB (radical SAM superfamily)
MSQVIAIRKDSFKKFPIKSFQNLICLEPFRAIEIDIHGEIRMCSCSGWMPITIGNIFENTLEELLTSSLSQDIRDSILNGTYEYCNEKTCGVINNNQLIDSQLCDPSVLHDPDYFLNPVDITVGGDATCNLSCPSCRTHIIKNSRESVERQQQLGKLLTDNIFSKKSTRKMTVRVSTTGEIFASQFLMEFVKQIPWDNYPNLELVLQTNGLLAEKNWHKLGNCANRIKNITVTVDAASAGTYEKLRRGGRWVDLINAMHFLQSKVNEHDMTLTTRMVVQVDNYREVNQFYEFSKSFGAGLVEYARILDWNTYAAEEFSKIDVFSPLHPERDLAINEFVSLRGREDVMIYNNI